MAAVEGLRGSCIAVSGAGGFLGSAVVHALSDHGARVRALLGPTEEASRLRRPRAEWLGYGALAEAQAVASWLEGADQVVHLAGPPSVAASFVDPASCIRAHGEGTAAVLEACRRQGISRLIYLSSAEVYGRSVQAKVDERAPLQARSPYAAAKIGAEKVIESWAYAHGLSGIVLRPFSIYGPGAHPDSLARRIIAMARAGGPIRLRNLRPIRDYCHVADLAEAVVRSCEWWGAGLETLNVGTGRGTSVDGLARIILQAMGLDLEIVESGDRDRPGASELETLVADNGRAAEVLGWQPLIPLEAGIRMTLEAGEGT